SSPVAGRGNLAQGSKLDPSHKAWKTLDRLFRDKARPRQLPPVLQALACRTKAKLGTLETTFTCYLTLARQRPQEGDLIRQAVDPGDRHQKPEVAIAYLEALSGERPVEELLDLGYRYKSLQRSKKAEEYFRRAYRDKELPQAGLALALSLRKRGQTALAAARF